MIWNNKFLFTSGPITDKYIIPSKGTELAGDVIIESKTKGVWIYDSTTKRFLNYVNSVKECEIKYNISRTHFKRIRKYNQPYKGKIFSNIKLHTKNVDTGRYIQNLLYFCILYFPSPLKIIF